MICKSLSHEELKWTKFGHDLTGVTITKSEVMQDIEKMVSGIYIYIHIDISYGLYYHYS